jgi:hypothetical protein
MNSKVLSRTQINNFYICVNATKQALSIEWALREKVFFCSFLLRENEILSTAVGLIVCCVYVKSYGMQQLEFFSLLFLHPRQQQCSEWIFLCHVMCKLNDLLLLLLFCRYFGAKLRKKLFSSLYLASCTINFNNC